MFSNEREGDGFFFGDVVFVKEGAECGRWRNGREKNFLKKKGFQK